MQSLPNVRKKMKNEKKVDYTRCINRAHIQTGTRPLRNHRNERRNCPPEDFDVDRLACGGGG